jgi:phosphomannomutase
MSFHPGDCRKSSLVDVLSDCAAKFGTSGFRGLASELTDLRCYVCVGAFLSALRARAELLPDSAVAVGMDLRPSSPRIAAACLQAIHDQGCRALYAGAVSSPALTLYGLSQKIPTVMITGSHIPDDRNGLKFTSAAGEIGKADETSILQQVVDVDASHFDAQGSLLQAPSVAPSIEQEVWQNYKQRYLKFFGAQALQGLRLGVYQHSAVARDFLVGLYQSLGAEVLAFSRSDRFIPVDTEAIRPEDLELGISWARDHQIDALLSADGDSDRPLLAGSDGRWLRGDVLGILAAKYLGAAGVAVPVSCNTALEACGSFKHVSRCKIGSPYVIAAMQALEAKEIAPVVGYEANGGFLLQSALINAEGQRLDPLPSRDCLLPQLATLLLAKQRRCSIQQLLAQLPSRVTASDRIKETPTAKTQAFLSDLWSGDQAKALENAGKLFAGEFGSAAIAVDKTDGLRFTLANQEIIHYRGSGNAPELRCYAEATSQARAEELVRIALGIAGKAIARG